MTDADAEKQIRVRLAFGEELECNSWVMLVNHWDSAIATITMHWNPSASVGVLACRQRWKPLQTTWVRMEHPQKPAAFGVKLGDMHLCRKCLKLRVMQAVYGQREEYRLD